jgi:hypothetical protein
VRALTDSTIRSSHSVLRSALDGAVRDSLIATNSAAAVKRAGVERQAAAGAWGDDDGLVFTADRGTPVDPRNLLLVVEVSSGGSEVVRDLGDCGQR